MFHGMLQMKRLKVPWGYNMTSLTFVDDLEDDLSIFAMYVWRVAHLADVGAIKGRGNLVQGDGGISSHNISRPNRMVFKTPMRGRIRRLLVVKHLTQTHTHTICTQDPVKVKTIWGINTFTNDVWSSEII